MKKRGFSIGCFSLILAIVGIVLAVYAFPKKEWCAYAYLPQTGSWHYYNCWTNYADCNSWTSAQRQVDPSVSFDCRKRECPLPWDCWTD